jgi:hypothetical protein
VAPPSLTANSSFAAASVSKLSKIKTQDHDDGLKDITQFRIKHKMGERAVRN